MHPNINTGIVLVFGSYLGSPKLFGVDPYLLGFPGCSTKAPREPQGGMDLCLHDSSGIPWAHCFGRAAREPSGGLDPCLPAIDLGFPDCSASADLPGNPRSMRETWIYASPLGSLARKPKSYMGRGRSTPPH